MRTNTSAFIILFLLGGMCGHGEGPSPVTSSTHQIKLNGHTFTLPAGFTIELAATSPLVDRPIVADFDEQGRLYVADSSGSNEKVDVQLMKKPHRIVRLEDSDGDGKYDKSVVFADKMMFPEGCMWYAGSLYVAAPPSIWKLTDTDGDGVADQRIEWFKGETLTGCANDLHGPYLGPDGWIYWAKGAFAKQTHQVNGKPFTTRASHIFRARPDGSGIEPVMTGGMDNPVDVAFLPNGDRFFTTTFFQHPGGGKRDGLIHAVYGGIYGKDHDPIYEHPWTGPTLMPVLAHMGPAAPCGLHRYESNAFGREYKDNLFACQFNMQKVSRHVLTPDGATYKSQDSDFLVSDNRDFHPTDVIEDADGSLLVIDTGGWYKLCCPTSQLAKTDVLGAIYRVRRVKMPRLTDPRGLKMAWDRMSLEGLTCFLAGPRPAVTRRAMAALAAKGEEAMESLAEILAERDNNPIVRRNAVWIASRVKSAAARKATRAALRDPDETVRQAALHSVALWRDRDARPELFKLLKSSVPHDRRAAAEALGRIGSNGSVGPLLEAASEASDRVLEHSIVYALLEIGSAEGTAFGLKSADANTRRAALTSLDQMPGGKIEAAAVAHELASTDSRMKETAWWIASRHPEWSGELTGVLRERLSAKSLTSAEQTELAAQLARFARAVPTQKLLAELLVGKETPQAGRRIVLQAMAQAGLREAPAAWLDGVTEVLITGNALLASKAPDASLELQRDAANTARALRLPKQRPESFTKALLQTGSNDALPADVRLAALAAVPGGPGKLLPFLFDFLREQLAPEKPTSLRIAAADVLSRARLLPEQLLALTDSVKIAGPMEVERLLDAFAASTEEKVGLNLVAALKTSPARSNLRVESLKPRLAKFSPAVRKQADELVALMEADTANQREKLEELLSLVKDGDIRRGQAVFNGTKAACATCHTIGYLGGKTGPDLTRIGGIRSDRDLLEAIVFPNASFVRSYEPMLVTTKSGKIHNGILRKDAPDEVILAIDATQELRIPRDEIDEVLPGKVSVMPAGLDQQLTPRELADLVAFLRACK